MRKSTAGIIASYPMLKKALHFFHSTTKNLPPKSRKKLFIHAGMFKTGTSFFQQTIYSNKNVLEEAGILYPSTGLGLGTGHNEYAHRLLGINLTSGKSNDFPQITQELVSRSDISKGLISYEGFCHPNTVSALLAIKECLNPIELHGILVFRPHLDHAFSVYREACQHLSFCGSLVNIIQTPSDPFENHWHATLKYRDIVTAWQKLVGNKQLQLFAFEEIKHDLLQTLLKAVAASGTGVTPNNQHRNPSLSAPCAELMRRVNTTELKAVLRHQIAYRLHRVDTALPHLADYCELPLEDVQKYEDLFRQDRLFLQEQGFDEAHLKVGAKWKWGFKTGIDTAVEEALETFHLQLAKEGRMDLSNLVHTANCGTL